ncbi:hypothetical protein BGX33_004797 [Mortierella sp. NVP41]|nr:hypothetical protein BGX33_004797 [Mortierella sp. NVP41]
MLWLHHLLLAAIAACLCLVFSPSHDVQSASSDVFKGSDAELLLRHFIGELDRGLPSGWERLMHPPQTTGTSAVQVVDPLNLYQMLDGWDLHPSIRDQVYRDVELLISLHAEEVVYTSQRFQYGIPGCRGGDIPVCMQTLLVVVRRLSLADELSAVEIRHIYADSFSSAIQQVVVGESCHRCWFRRCCHTTYTPRELNNEELVVIEAVLSTHLSWWANGAFPTVDGFSLSTQTLSLQEQIRQFMKNDVENEEVFKAYDDDDVLLNTIQESARSTRPNTRSFSVSLREQNLGILDNFFSSCLKKANLDETVQEMWRRTRDGQTDKPFSLECQSIKQVQFIEDIPTESCNKTSVVKVDTQYSWVQLSPRSGLLECIFISSEMSARHSECIEPVVDPDHPDEGPFPRSKCHSLAVPNPVQEGSIVRLSEPQVEGYFFPVHYIAQWSAYSPRVNKAVMDMLRYASAAAYLRIPIPRAEPRTTTPSSLSALLGIHTQAAGAGESMIAIGKGLGAIGDGWSKLANAIGNSASETVTRQICPGFQRYEHTTKALYAQGLDQDRFVEVVNALIDLAHVQVPDVEDLRRAMVVLEFSPNVTWTGEQVMYTSDDGFHRFFYFYKYANEETQKIDIVFGTLASSFTIAPDVLVVHKRRSTWLGLRKSEEVLYRNVPHVMSVTDTVLLNTYFEVVAYRKLAVVLRLPIPQYPSMQPVCT